MTEHSDLGSRMKGYEAETNYTVDPSKPFIIRLDGHRFSKFTKSFIKPYDERIHRAMVLTTMVLMETFSAATTGFTQSDEITLLFPAFYPHHDGKQQQQASQQQQQESSGDGCGGGRIVVAATSDADAKDEDEDEEGIPYGGRIQKLASMSAALCSVKFNNFLMKETYKENEKKLMEKVLAATAYFDARVFNVPNEIELANNLIWRSTFDSVRNSKSLLGVMHFPQKQLQGVPANEIVRMLKEQKNVDWNDMPSQYKFGSVIKREEYSKEGYNPKTKQTVVTTRRRLAVKSFRIPTDDTKALAELIMAKTWPESFPHPSVLVSTGPMATCPVVAAIPSQSSSSSSSAATNSSSSSNDNNNNSNSNSNQR